MKVLVSAYACNPYRGSEPGVGWTAVCRIAREHDVFVITDVHNREGWEQAAREGKVPKNVKVRIIRDHSNCSANRFIAHIQSWLNYSSFNHQILATARSWHEEEKFDLCHQVTIAGWRMPSPLWKLPIPFVWGPIGGGGYIPSAFRTILSAPARAFEFARDFNSAYTLRTKAFQDCITNSAVVFAANEETELLLKPHRGNRPLVRLPIASIPPEKAEKFLRPEEVKPTGPLRLFAGGNMEGRKGVSLALKALARVAKAGIDFRYTVAGGGPEIPALMKLAGKLDLTDRVEFHPGFSGQDYIAALQASDVYFLPSFRESTPVTLLEAYLAGCYPVVADTSAQGEIVRMAGGSAVPVIDMEQLIEGLAEAIIDCARHRDDLPRKVGESRVKLIAYFDSARYDQAIADAYRVAMESHQDSI